MTQTTRPCENKDSTEHAEGTHWLICDEPASFFCDCCGSLYCTKHKEETAAWANDEDEGDFPDLMTFLPFLPTDEGIYITPAVEEDE